MVPQLMSLGRFEGAGHLQVSPTGFERTVFILRYHGGKIEEVTPGSDGN
jgi:hypothetical protein